MEQTNAPAPQVITPTAEPPLVPKSSGSHPLVIIALLLTFPPVAFLKMWKEPRYHPWFAFFLWITGLVSITFPLMFMIFVTPKLTALYQDFGRTYDMSQSNSLSFISITTGVIQLLFGIWVFYKTRNKQALSKLALIFTLVIVSIGLIVAFISYQNIALSAVFPIYNLL